MILPCRPHSGHRQAFLKGLTRTPSRQPRRKARPTQRSLELEQFSAKLVRGHGACLLSCLFVKTKRYRRSHELSSQALSGLKIVARSGSTRMFVLVYSI